MGYDFDKLIDRRGTDNFKWDKLEERYGKKDILPFWIADMEFETAPEITDALIKRSRHGIFGYSFKSDRFYEAVMKWYEERHHWAIKREWIIGCPGVMAGLSICIENLSVSGSSIITLSPAYPGFYEKILENRRHLVVSELKLSNGEYSIDYEDFEQKIREETCKLFIFCNPHNPSGRVWKKEELEMLLAVCRRNEVTILSDDIHCDIVYSGSRYIPLASIAGEFEKNIVTLSAPGKTFNLTGLATSIVMLTDREKREQFKHTLDRYDLGDGNLFGNLAARTAYEMGGGWVDCLLKYLEENRDYVIDYIRQHEMPVEVIRPEGTYMMLLKCGSIGSSDEAIRNRLIDEAGLLMNQGDTFGRNTGGYVRMNFACPRALLRQGLERLHGLFRQ